MRPEITKRGVIYITKVCNINCEFCYYRHEKNKQSAPFESVARTLKWFSDTYGLKYVDLTGGEPTIHKDIIEIVRESVRNGIKPTIITNGQKPELVDEFVDAGLNDMLVSIHGSEKSHDEVTGRKGAFNRLMETIHNLKKAGCDFRVNTTLTRYSCEEIDSIIKLYLELKPRMVNLIAFNPHEGTLWSDSVNLKFQVPYSEQARVALRAVNTLNKAGIWANVRYMPHCFMKGYEQHICNFRQLQYDPYEWEYLSAKRMGKDEIDESLSKAVKSGVYGETRDEKLYNYLTSLQVQGNNYAEQCNSCANREICDGIYQQYLNTYGENEFLPVSGEKIKDPLHYRLIDRRWEELE